MDKPSTSEEVSDEDDDIIEIGGVDVSHLARDENGQNDELLQAMNRFMRNEIDYNEFMRATGGKTIDEELADGDREDGVDDEQIMEECDGSNDEYEITFDNTKKNEINEKHRLLTLPPEARGLLGDVFPASSSGESVDGQPTFSQILRKDEEEIEESSEKVIKEIKEEPKSEARREVDRGKSKRMDALLGQANVMFARGQMEESLELLMEVIRQDPLNAVAYRQISVIYDQKDDIYRSLQYGLLSGHLDSKTSAEDWIHWGDQAKNIGMLNDASSCYEKAIRKNSENWEYYERRISTLDSLGLRPLAMRTRLLAAQNINHVVANVNFEWFQQLIRTVAQYYITMNDEEKTIAALEAFVLRSREFEKSANVQHETLVGMWLAKGRFLSAAKSIVALCDGLTMIEKNTKRLACSVTYLNGTYFVHPFPPTVDVSFYINNEKFPILMHCNIIICFVHLDFIEKSWELIDLLFDRDLSKADNEMHILDVIKAFKHKEKNEVALELLDKLEKSSFPHEKSFEFYYLKGLLYMETEEDVKASDNFELVLSIKPDHVDSRIHLSTLQQKAGLFEKALITLEDMDLDLCSEIPDERLLMKRADMLFESGSIDKFIRTARLLLVPHFYEVHNDQLKRKRQSKSGQPLSHTLRMAVLNVIQNTNWERFVKRLGKISEQRNRPLHLLGSNELHDYCMKLIESLMNIDKYQDATVVCCYAYLHPKLSKNGRHLPFRNMLYYCSIKSRNWMLAFEFIRWIYTHTISSANSENLDYATRDMFHKRIFNAMNFVFVNSQSVSFHRFIIRTLTKNKENHALQAISGNNSLITGTYRHALGEYLRVWVSNRKNPLICLLLALTFTHMACKKDISDRHLISIRALAFMKKYQKSRSVSQEVNYNIGRMFHQLSNLPLAIHFYEKVLEDKPPQILTVDDEGNECYGSAERYDLRKMAAHNLALIYKNSGNELEAREIYDKHLVI